jgi:hypothetical protein
MWHVWGEKRTAYTILAGKPERKRPLGKFRRRWEGAVKKDLKERGWEGLDAFHLTQDQDKKQALLKTVTNLLFFFFFIFSFLLLFLFSSSTTVRCGTSLPKESSSLPSGL